MVRNSLIVIIVLTLVFIGCRKKNWIKDETGWTQIKIDKNPGWLKFYKYIPENLDNEPALVVALHGCTQNAEEIAYTTGWNDLADRYGFIVIYPQQKGYNNVSKCFNWFLGMDNERTKGEAESIANATKEIIEEYGVNEDQVFVTGLSAGAGMTNIMAACYPDLYKAGAPYAGPPYKVTAKAGNTMGAMFGTLDLTPEEWKKKVTDAFPGYSGNYPRMCILQGTNDAVNNPNNSNESEEQWMAVHNLDEDDLTVINSFDGHSDVTKRCFIDANQDTLVVYYKLSGIGHTVAIDEGNGEKKGGHSAMYAKQYGFYSTYWIANFFGITQ